MKGVSIISMITIMLVDDEPFIRVAIKALFHWEEHGFQIVSETSNGKSALIELEKNPVDIILTDIKMPLMNGIELIERVKQLYPGTLCVVLSNYNDFELTRSAFRAGAVDYLLKNDLNIDNYLSLTKHLKETYFNDRPQTPKIVFQSPPSVSERELCIRTLRQAIEETDSVEFDYEILDRKCPYVISHIFLDGSTTFDGNNLIRDTVYKIISELSEFKLYYYAHAVTDYVLMIYNEEESNISFYKKITTFFDSLSSNLEIYLNVQTIMGVSNIKKEIWLIPEASEEAFEQSQKIFYCQSSTLFFQHLEKPEKQQILELVKEEIDSIPRLVISQDWIGLKSLVFHLLDSIERTYYRPPKAKRLLVNLQFLIANEIVHCFSKDSLFMLDAESVYEDILNATKIDDVRQYLEKFFHDPPNFFSTDESEETYSQITAEAINYLHLNFCDSTTNLGTVAKAISVNPSYLSRLFHKETHENFNSFLTSLRMTHAKYLLRSTQKSIADIADACGYNTPKYFITTFRQLEGITPAAYRSTQ